MVHWGWIIAAFFAGVIFGIMIVGMMIDDGG